MWLAWIALGWAQTPQRVGIVEHAPIAEQSGIVQSVRWPGVYWVHNDSGDVARLFAISGSGEVMLPPWDADDYTVGPRARPGGRRPAWPGLIVEGATNIDWEDIAVHRDHLYIADMGNNGNARRDLGVYVLVEPNPRATIRARPLAFWPIAYPGQQQFPAAEWRYDCEAIFVREGRLYFVTKHREDRRIGVPATSADLYRLDTQHTDTVNVLTHVDHFDDLGGWVTGADLSPDGRTLALLVDAPASSVWLFPNPERGDAFSSGEARRIELDRSVTQQVEGLAWIDDRRLQITNEQRELYELALE